MTEKERPRTSDLDRVIEEGRTYPLINRLHEAPTKDEDQRALETLETRTLPRTISQKMRQIMLKRGKLDNKRKPGSANENDVKDSVTVIFITFIMISLASIFSILNLDCFIVDNISAKGRELFN